MTLELKQGQLKLGAVLFLIETYPIHKTKGL